LNLMLKHKVFSNGESLSNLKPKHDYLEKGELIKS